MAVGYITLNITEWNTISQVFCLKKVQHGKSILIGIIKTKILFRDTVA